MHEGAFPDEVGVRLRASFTPWYRAVLYGAGMLVGVGLWMLGTQGPPSAGWADGVAWVPFVSATCLVLHWQRAALRAGTHRPRPH